MELGVLIDIDVKTAPIDDRPIAGLMHVQLFASLTDGRAARRHHPVSGVGMGGFSGYSCKEYSGQYRSA